MKGGQKRGFVPPFVPPFHFVPPLLAVDLTGAAKPERQGLNLIVQGCLPGLHSHPLALVQTGHRDGACSLLHSVASSPTKPEPPSGQVPNQKTTANAWAPSSQAQTTRPRWGSLIEVPLVASWLAGGPVRTPNQPPRLFQPIPSASPIPPKSGTPLGRTSH